MAKRTVKRREWTKGDIRDLKAFARQKTPARKIARALKRTEGATRTQVAPGLLPVGPIMAPIVDTERGRMS
jgi:hypothetical protein